MVFSSISADLDPSNWQQPQYQEEGFIWSTLHHGNSIVNQNNSNPLLLPPQPPPLTNGPMGGPGPITRPISMAVKCPRCESTNTKFCYYNNRSLSQPRHLCRSCRRHWTHGGTLRPVPVGGARRKNKRSKSSSSSSGASSTATLVPAPVLGLTDYHGGVNYSVNGFKMESFNNNGSVRVEQWRILAPPEQPPQFPFELEDELSSFEIGHVIGSNELEEIGQLDDEFGNAYFN